MRIRFGEKSDLPEIGALIKGLWVMHAENNLKFMNEKRIKGYTEKHILKYLSVCFKKPQKSYLLIAEEEGIIAGFLKIDIIKIQPFFIENKVLYLDDIYVKSEFREKGISKLLYKEAEKIAKNKKIKMLKARIYTFNSPAQKMASSMGLVPIYSEYFKPLE